MEELAAKLETEARLRKTGLIDPEQEHFAEKRLAAVADHLTAFESSLGDNTGHHAYGWGEIRDRLAFGPSSILNTGAAANVLAWSAQD